MVDIRFIRENPDAIKEAARKKRVEFDVDAVIQQDARRRVLIQKIDDLRARRNQGSKEISSLQGEAKQAAIQQMQGVVADLKQVEPELAELDVAIASLLLEAPLPPSDDIPEGDTDADNVEVRTWGQKPEFGFKSGDHLELAEGLGILDIERGVKLAGSRSYILKGRGALLHWGILRLAMDHMVDKGFTPITVPVTVREDYMIGTAYFPQGKEQAYAIERDDLYLVGTAEVSLTSYHAGEILTEDELPVRLVSNSPCFRREAGTYGKDTRGIYRIHQFDKVEQVVLSPNDVALSDTIHAEMLNNTEQVVQQLELPYRVVVNCTGDMGLGKYRMHDIECWMPGRDGYGETHSCSSFHEFQARRLNLRYRDNERQVKFVHTHNNTVIASPRILIPLLEVHQQKDGSVIIPEALRPYIGGLEVLEPIR